MAGAYPPSVVIFGASGFVGRNLVEGLQGMGSRLVALTSTTPHVPGCELTVPIDQIDTIPALPPETVVVNVAAHRYDAADFALAQSEILVRNTALAAAAYDFCVRRGLKEMRLASSVAVYPAGRTILDDSEPVSLDDPPHESEAFYAWSKRWAELCAELYHRRYGINTMTFRLTNPYGPFDSLDVQRAHVLAAFVIRALSPEPAFEIRGNPAAERDFVYVGDVARVLASSLTHTGRHDVFNMAYGSTVTIEQLAHAVLSAAGVHKEIVAAPHSGGVAARCATAQRLWQVFPEFVPTPLDQGLANTVAWYRHALAG